MGNCSNNLRKFNGNLKVDLQDQICNKWGINKYKAIFIVRGFSYKEGEDYNKVLEPVSKLKKGLHGIKQAMRALYYRIDGYVKRLGFSKSVIDPNLYVKVVKGE